MMGPSETKCESCHRAYDHTQLKQYDGYESPHICFECYTDNVLEFMDNRSLDKLKAVIEWARKAAHPSQFHRSRVEKLQAALAEYDASREARA